MNRNKAEPLETSLMTIQIKIVNALLTQSNLTPKPSHLPVVDPNWMAERRLEYTYIIETRPQDTSSNVVHQHIKLLKQKPHLSTKILLQYSNFKC